MYSLKSCWLIACFFYVLLFISPQKITAQDSVFTSIGPFGGFFTDVVSNSSGKLFASTHFGGIYISEDEAESWTFLGHENLEIWRMAVGPNDEIYTFGDGHGQRLFRSIDDGISFQAISENLPCSCLIRDINFASDGTIYLATGDGGIFKTEDDGEEWESFGLAGSNTSTILPLADDILIAGVPDGIIRSEDSGQSWTYIYTVPNPGNYPATKLIKLADGTLLASFFARGVHRSDDGGVTWEPSSNGIVMFSLPTIFETPNQSVLLGEQNFQGTLDFGVIFRSNNSGLFWHNSGIEVSSVTGFASLPNGSLFASTSNGVYKSDDDGITWQPSNIGQTAKNVSHLRIHPNGIFTAGFQREGLYGSEDGGNSWELWSKEHKTGQSSPRDVLFLENNDETQKVLALISSGLYDLNSWERILLASFNAKFHTTAGGSILIKGSSVFRSSDNGENWTRIPGFSTTAIVELSEDNLLAIRNTNRISNSSDDGKTWEFGFELDLLDGFFASTIVKDDSGKLFAGVHDYYRTTGGIIESNDQGVTWEWTSNVPEVAVNAIVIDHEGSMIIGTSKGVYKRVGDSEEWEQMPMEPSNDIHVGYLAIVDDGRILAGTYYHGLLEYEANATPISMESNTDIPKQLDVRNYPNPFNPATTIEANLPEDGRLTIKVFDITGRLITVLADEVRPAGVHSFHFDAQGLATGIYFYKTETKQGLHTGMMTLVK